MPSRPHIACSLDLVNPEGLKRVDWPVRSDASWLAGAVITLQRLASVAKWAGWMSASAEADIRLQLLAWAQPGELDADGGSERAASRQATSR